MMTNKEIADEVWRRVAIAEKQKRRRRQQRMFIFKTAAASVVSIAVIFGAAYVLWRYGLPGTSLRGYILTGIIAFASGAALTLICRNRQARAAPPNPANSEAQTTPQNNLPPDAAGQK